MAGDWLYPSIKERFEKAFRRPFPWYESVDGETVDVLYRQASKLVPGGPYGSLSKLMIGAMDHVQWEDLIPIGDPPSLVRTAIGRFGIDPGETAMVVTDHSPVYRFHSNDLIEFGEAIFPDPTSYAQSLVGEKGDWLVVFDHMGPVGAMRR